MRIDRFHEIHFRTYTSYSLGPPYIRCLLSAPCSPKLRRRLTLQAICLSFPTKPLVDVNEFCSEISYVQHCLIKLPPLTVIVQISVVLESVVTEMSTFFGTVLLVLLRHGRVRDVFRLAEGDTFPLVPQIVVIEKTCLANDDEEQSNEDPEDGSDSRQVRGSVSGVEQEGA